MSQAVLSDSFAARTASARQGWLWLTVPIAALLALASAMGVFVPSLYQQEMPYFATQGIGQDFADLVIVAPALAVSGYLAARGSRRALMVWLGVVIYTLYSYVIYAFYVHFNVMFLVYVALLGCTLYAVIFSLRGIDAGAVQAQMQGKRSTTAVGIMLALIAAFFYILWLRDVLPALIAGTALQSAVNNGLPTNPIEVMDMAIILPGIILTVIGLRRNSPISYVLAPAMLGFSVFLAIALMSMGVFALRAGFAGNMGIVGIFGVLSVINGSLLAWYLRDLRRA